tara:strand:- start:231 stop:398 length:168 start_codon:yes stop_codon:yes gene_type:complete
MSYTNRYNERIEQLENEIKEKQEEIELTNNQSTIDILEEDIYNTRQSINELKKYV